MKKSVAVVVCLLAGAMGVGATPSWALTAEQEAKLLASDGTTDDRFGAGVALGGDTAMIGAWLDGATGSAYVFIRTGGVWAEHAKLLPSEAPEWDGFGIDAALDGDTAVIGAWGAAYVFTRTGGVWTEQAKLLPADGEEWIAFGGVVALDGDTAVIGANGDNDNGEYSGSAYVFTRMETVWSQQAKLLAPDGAAEDSFGIAIALDGDTAVVGAWGDDDNGSDSGSAYVFTRAEVAWTQQAKLLASDGAADDKFGYGVALDGDTAVIGASGDDDNGESSGSTYVFTRTGGVWSEQAKLLAADGAAIDSFGHGIALDGDTAVIGSRCDDDNGDYSGSAYVFTRTEAVWTEQAKLLASDGEQHDDFGGSIALDGDTVVIGARYDDDNGPLSGSAYVFRLYDDDVPATSAVSLALLLLTVLGTGVYFARRRATG